MLSACRSREGGGPFDLNAAERLAECPLHDKAPLNLPHNRCRPFLAGCEDWLRKARALRADEGYGPGADSLAVLIRSASEDALGLLSQMRRCGGAGALEALRSAAAASFPEVARALGAPEAAATSSKTAAAAPAGATEAGPVTTVARVCAACGAADAPLTCGACRDAHYCSAACQKRDWRAHKAACKQRQREMSTGAAAAEKEKQQQQ